MNERELRRLQLSLLAAVNDPRLAEACVEPERVIALAARIENARRGIRSR